MKTIHRTEVGERIRRPARNSSPHGIPELALVIALALLKAPGALGAISDYFAEREIMASDDGGAYYLRQVSEYDALFWFGQEFANEPRFANVYFGRLNRGARYDERTNRVDRWVGRAYEVPKGTNCHYGPLTIESLVVPPNPRRTCDFPLQFLRKAAEGAFVGMAWGLERNLLGCWESAPAPSIPFPIGTLPGWEENVNRVSSAAVPAGFQGRGTANLSGTWQGDDGGTYYLRDIPETAELVWFAESTNATPGVPGKPGTGWAYVFIGTRTNSGLITGLCADVPKGARNCYGRLSLQMDSAFRLRVIGGSACYAVTNLWRYDSLAVTLDFRELTVRRSEDRGGDEPKLEATFVKMDADGIRRDSLTTSHAISLPRSTHRLGSSVRSGRVLTLDPSFGHYDAVVKTIIGGSPTGPAPPETMIATAVAAWDEDSTSGGGRAEMFDDYYAMLQRNLDRDIRAGRTPDFRALVGRRHFRFSLFTDDDDFLNDGDRAWRYSDLERLARGTGEDSFVFEMTGDGAHYVVPGILRVRSRLNPACLP